MRTVAVPAPVSFGPLCSKRLLALASDDTLVEQIRRGNEAAFSVTFERYAAGLLGFCRHMVGSREEAEDAVQDTFAAAFRDLARPGEREVALKPWLYAVARNRCQSILRSRRKQAVLDFDLPTEGLAEQVERRADLRDLLRDLRELPEDQRAALLLSEAGDLSHAEVAGVLGCEVGNVKALVFRARSGLLQRREARETACADIREQLATLRGSSLRRRRLRHHLRSCAGCRAYSEQVKHQRQMLRTALPVMPSLELKSGVLAAAGLGGGSAAGGVVAGVGVGVSASLGTVTLVQVAAVGVLFVGGVASLHVLIDDSDGVPLPAPRTAAQAAPSSRSDSGAPPGAKQPISRDLQRGNPRVVDRGAGPRVPDQRSGAAPPIPGRADGEGSLGQDQNNANRSPLAEEDPPTGAERRDGPGAVDLRSESHGRGPTSEPPAGTHGQGGPPAGMPVKGSPPSSAPDRGGAPSSAPHEGRPSSSAPERGSPSSSAPERGGPSSSAPHEGRPSSSVAERGGPSSSAPHEGRPSSSVADRGGPSASAAERGGPSSSVADRGGPPSSAPHVGRPPSSAPERGGPPSSVADRGGPPSSVADRGGPPSSVAERGGPPSSSPAPVQHEPPAPKPQAERPLNPTAPPSPPVATPRRAPVSERAPAPGPAGQPKGPGK